ncbi:hypothetical protein COI02_07605 [Neisseria meningitidis]|nr:hypothetical protein COI02_07605 [Neisseria meningitidis]
MINQYIFYAGVFFLIGIPSFMRMPAAHIKNGKIRWENTMGKYDGKIRWENTMGKYDGKIRWENTMGKYDGKIRYSPRYRTICQLKELVSTIIYSLTNF